VLGSAEALRQAQELFLFTAEFHATNLNEQRSVPRAIVPPTPTLARPYKAVVYMYLAGGADTYNMLVPHSNCGTNDLYNQYRTIRGVNHMPHSRLLPITASGQPCGTFGVHEALTSLKAAYDDGDAAFIANVGPLSQPITKAG